MGGWWHARSTDLTGGIAMALSRKQRKDRDRLRKQAERVWDDQKELLDHAADVVREASRQASDFAREELAHRVKDTYEGRIAPTIGSGVAGARSAAGTARDKLTREVLPAVTSALGTALAAIEVARNKQVREAIVARRQARHRARHEGRHRQAEAGRSWPIHPHRPGGRRGRCGRLRRMADAARRRRPVGRGRARPRPTTPTRPLRRKTSDRTMNPSGSPPANRAPAR